MNAPKLSWPSVVIALLTAAGMVVAGAGLGLVAGVLLLWLGTLWLARPEEPARTRLVGDRALAGQRMGSLIEPLGQPLLLLEHNRVVLANRAARETLGSHILEQDVRLVLRHPAAVALFERDDGGSVSVQGLTTARSIWQVARRPVSNRYAMVELINRTAEADISRAHTDFVANASHELSTPLASIIGYVETLADRDAHVDEPTAARFHATVLREARRLQSLVRDLLSLSRIEAEKHDRPNERVDLAKLATSVTGEIAATLAEGRLVLESRQGPAMIAGDRGQLDQLLRNLIDNALKYGDPAAPVTVTITADDGRAVLSVADRGPGIAPEHLPHLTRRFYRTDPGRSRAAGGTGLGLAIVKHIVERHQGHLDIASSLGQGTVVTARFDRLAVEAACHEDVTRR